MTRLAKKLLVNGLAKVGIQIVRTRRRYAQDGLVTIHNDHFRHTVLFRAAYRRGLKASAGVDPRFEWRVHVALWAAMAAMRVPGDFVECGVNTGFISSAIMHGLDWNTRGRNYYLIDTFTGPPLDQYTDTEIVRGRRRLAEKAISAGEYVVDVNRVRDNFAEWQNVVIVKGVVPEILPTIPIRQVAFLHIDMNSAHPEEAAFEFFWERLSSGAIVLLDDYAYHGHEEQATAMDRVAKERGAEILSLPTGQGLVIR
jgi:hypothetical protein